MNKKVLVTGGSGFLGINMIRYLLHQGITDITVLDLVEFDYPERDRIKAVQGDIRNSSTVSEVMKGVNWVIHTAAALPLYTKEEIFSTDIEGTRILLAAAEKEKVERFRAYLFHRRLRHPRPPPALRNRSADRRRPLWPRKN